MLYNVPGRTQVNLLPETVARLAENPNIAAIKEASGNLEQVSYLRSITPDDFLIFPVTIVLPCQSWQSEAAEW